MIRTLIITLALTCSLPCMAGSSQHFLRALGSFSLSDATNRTTVTAFKSSNSQITVAIRFERQSAEGTPIQDGITKPLTRDGWFVFAESATHIWVFTGETLSLVHHEDKKTSDESSAEVDKTCPKEVRDALPESFRKSGRFKP